MADPEEWVLQNFEDSKKMCIRMMQRNTPSVYEIEKHWQNKRQLMCDMHSLQREFAKVCPDFFVEPQEGNVQQTSEFFAREILFQISPKFSWVRNVDKEFSVMLVNKDAYGNVVRNRVVIHIFKKFPPQSTIHPRAIDGTIHLTLQQAWLLALKKMEKAMEFSFAKGGLFMTPLAGSNFRGPITALYNELKELGVSYDMAHLVKIINQSVYDGGENLDYSELHCAAAFTVSTTSNMRNRFSAMAIIRRRVWRYMLHGKKADVAKFEIFLKYTTVGQHFRSIGLDKALTPLTALQGESEHAAAGNTKLRVTRIEDEELDSEDSNEDMRSAETDISDQEYITADSSDEESFLDA